MPDRPVRARPVPARRYRPSRRRTRLQPHTGSCRLLLRRTTTWFASRLLFLASEAVTQDRFDRVGRRQLIAVHIAKYRQFDIGKEPHGLVRCFKTGSDLYSEVTGVVGIRICAAVVVPVADQKRQKRG